MSRIAFVANKESLSTSQLIGIKRTTGVSPSEIKSRMALGVPIFEAMLFENDHSNLDATLSGLVSFIEDEGLDVTVYELEPKEAFESAPLDHCKISTQILRDILEQARSEFS